MSGSPSKQARRRGFAVYSPRLLSFYDVFVLGFSNRCVWRCPTGNLLRLYRETVGQRHLDVGVGTGFFLDRTDFPAGAEITLADANENCLASASERIARHGARTVVWDIFESAPKNLGPFDSIGLNYVLHCLPGPLEHKLQVLDHLGVLLTEDGVLFGSTILAEEAPRNLLARKFAGFYNRKGIFGNTGDSLSGLRSGMEARFDQVEIEVIGCVALFRLHGARS